MIKDTLSWACFYKDLERLNMEWDNKEKSGPWAWSKYLNMIPWMILVEFWNAKLCVFLLHVHLRHPVERPKMSES